jgi:hypothetical protein
MLWAIPPSRGVGRPARKIEEPDYCMISVWEKCITTVTHPRFIGDGMSKLTGSVAPIDHAAYGHVKGHQKVDNVHIKVNYDPVTNPLLVCGAACRVGRARASSMRYAALSRCSSQCPGGILVSQRPAPQRAMDLVGSIVYVI